MVLQPRFNPKDPVSTLCTAISSSGWCTSANGCLMLPVRQVIRFCSDSRESGNSAQIPFHLRQTVLFDTRSARQNSKSFVQFRMRSARMSRRSNCCGAWEACVSTRPRSSISMPGTWSTCCWQGSAEFLDDFSILHINSLKPNRIKKFRERLFNFQFDMNNPHT